MAICDSCNAGLRKGDGYLTYSEYYSERDGGDIGLMLLCQNCADSVFTEAIWKEAQPITLSVDRSDAREYKRVQEKLISFGIALLAQRRKLNSIEAKQEARQLAQLWWKDRNAAEQKLANMILVPRMFAGDKVPRLA